MTVNELDWDGTPVLEKGRELLKKGDKSWLLYMVALCIRNRKPLPEWLEQEFLNAYYAGTSYEIKSWDEVFGRPLKKGGRLASERHKFKISESIFKGVQERHRAGAPIDKALFAAVGKENGVGGTVASEIYYEILKSFRED